MVLSTAEKYEGAYVGDHVRDASHIGKRKYTWSISVSQLLDPPGQIVAKPKADYLGADKKLIKSSKDMPRGRGLYLMTMEYDIARKISQAVVPKPRLG